MKSLTAIAVVVLALAGSAIGVWASSSSASSEPQTYQGKTAFQWHRVAVVHRLERDAARSKAGDAIREGRRLGRELRKTKRAVASAEAGGVLTSTLERNFLCIHGYEGSWTDPNSPYYGGLQMDLEFQSTYGPEFLKAFGTADHWPVSVQLAVAMRAYLSRGFGPWPNTARYCGLL